MSVFVVPVGAVFEEVAVQGTANLKEYLSVYPWVAEQFVEVRAGTAYLLCKPGNAASLPLKFPFYEFPDVEFFGTRCVFVVVHCFWLFEPHFAPEATKKALTVSFVAYSTPSADQSIVGE